MISLIKNELYKIFHKKSTIIILIITLLFIFLSNILYKNINYNDNQKKDDSYIKYLKDEIKTVDKNKDKELYYGYQSQIDAFVLQEKFKPNSWQYIVLNNDVLNIINDKYIARYVLNDNSKIIKTEKQYNDVIKLLDEDNWIKYTQYIIKIRQEELNDSDTNLEEKQIIKNEIEKLNIRIEKNIKYSDDYLNTALNLYDQNFPTLDQYLNKAKEKSKSDYDELTYKQNYKEEKIQNEKYKYELEYLVDMSKNDSLRNGIINLLNDYSIFIVIISITVAGTIVSSEFDKGTIKLLLIKPYKRSEILTSKIISSFIIIIFSIIFIFIAEFIIGGLFFGFNSLKIPVITYNFNTQSIQHINVFRYLIDNIFASLPELLLLSMLAISASTIINNSVLGVAIPILGFFVSEIINMIVTNFKLFFTKFLITMNWDFSAYLYGGLPIYKGLTISFSIMICILYFLILIIPTYFVFNKKNIKNI